MYSKLIIIDCNYYNILNSLLTNLVKKYKFNVWKLKNFYVHNSTKCIWYRTWQSLSHLFVHVTRTRNQRDLFCKNYDLQLCRMDEYYSTVHACFDRRNSSDLLNIHVYVSVYLIRPLIYIALYFDVVCPLFMQKFLFTLYGI